MERFALKNKWDVWNDGKPVWKTRARDKENKGKENRDEKLKMEEEKHTSECKELGFWFFYLAPPCDKNTKGWIRF
jgi:hypothetical protein